MTLLRNLLVAVLLIRAGHVRSRGQQGHRRHRRGRRSVWNTLVAAVKAAGLVDTLKGKGPFTVFAPTDDAFAKLPKGTVDRPSQA